MQGEEVIFLISFLVILPLFMTRMILNHRKWRHSVEQGQESESTGTRSFMGRGRRKGKRQSTTSDNSMTVTELEGMIRSAVADATEPMQDRLEDIERQLCTLKDNDEFDLDDEDDERETAEKTLGRRRTR